MKKFALTLILLSSYSFMFAGGILTNSNQSARFHRMLSRDASTAIDAVYYNPAGLMMLNNGFYLSFSNQTAFQTKTIQNDFPFLNEHTYTGDVTVPVFPAFYSVYKMDKLAISFGLSPNAGGGTATYSRGLPSFETQIAMLPAMITAMGIPTTNYTVDINFDGSSIFWGGQLGASYKFTDNISAFAGARYIYAINTYNGHINDIMINPNGTFMLATAFFTAAGDPIHAASTANKKVDVKQTGTGITPILGVNINFDKLNIGIKYEFKTKLELENETTTDETGMFPDGAKTKTDIPAIISLGVAYSITDDFKASVGVHHYFDKNADWDGREKFINNNIYELSCGLEYNVSEKVLVSGGYLHTQTGVGQGYQTDLNHSLSTNMVGFGGEFKVSEKLTLNAGMSYAVYVTDDQMIDYSSLGLPSYKETYDKVSTSFAIGIEYKLF
ncbi:MAG: hypothetical protein IMY72_01115 [Bacteroidetes bacterium]|nr:hypothetical protein [Bacteroidota bacterium]